MSDTFQCGFAFGLIAAGLLGLVLGQIREARVKMGRQFQSLDWFPDAIQPKLTPAGIVRDSMMATVGCVFWTVVLIVIFVLLWSLASTMVNIDW